ncbi:MAG: class I SAM-dependent methyltransferase [Alphaproteobacteria bacterium]
MASDARAPWAAYCTAKRIGHQWLQVALLNELPVQRVLEIGPYLGLVTAMLANAGYDVTTLDDGPPAFASPAVPHIAADLATLAPARVAGFDAILCCETLEHLPWDAVPGVLASLRAAQPRHLIVAVPYEAFQLSFSLYLNRYRIEHGFQLKKFRFLRRFRPAAEPGGHHWEIGYRGLGLTAWERRLGDAGWRIRRRAFTHPCRSVFHVLEAR